MLGPGRVGHEGLDNLEDGSGCTAGDVAGTNLLKGRLGVGAELGVSAVTLEPEARAGDFLQGGDDNRLCQLGRGPARGLAIRGQAHRGVTVELEDGFLESSQRRGAGQGGAKSVQVGLVVVLVGVVVNHGGI